MSFAKRHNKKKIFTVELEEGRKYTYLKLEDIKGVVYPVKALFINTKGNYGDEPVAFTGNEFINLPKWSLDEINAIRESDEDVADINAGKVGIKARPYTKDGKEYTGFEWVDIE